MDDGTYEDTIKFRVCVCVCVCVFFEDEWYRIRK